MFSVKQFTRISVSSDSIFVSKKLFYVMRNIVLCCLPKQQKIHIHTNIIQIKDLYFCNFV